MPDTELREWAREHVTIEERANYTWQLFVGETFVDEFDNSSVAYESKDWWESILEKAGESLIRQCAEIAQEQADYAVSAISASDRAAALARMSDAILRYWGMEGK